MRTRQVIGLAICVMLFAFTGCQPPSPQATQPPQVTSAPASTSANTSVTYVTPLGSTFAATETGQVLEWQLIPTTANISFFYVSFVGADPCGTHDPLIGWQGHPASCTVTATAPSGSYILYQYLVEVNTPPSEKGGPHPSHVVPCNNCGGVVAGPVGSNTLAAQPSPAPANLPAAGASFVPRAPTATPTVTIPGLIVISCDSGKVSLDQPNTSEAEVTWQLASTLSPNWTVTFGGTSPCSEGKVLSSASGSPNTCEVPTGQKSGKYSYTVHVDQGCATDGQGTITVPK
jgi:hypothetical protein